MYCHDVLAFSLSQVLIPHFSNLSHHNHNTCNSSCVDVNISFRLINFVFNIYFSLRLHFMASGLLSIRLSLSMSPRLLLLMLRLLFYSSETKVLFVLVDSVRSGSRLHPEVSRHLCTNVAIFDILLLIIARDVQNQFIISKIYLSLPKQCFVFALLSCQLCFLWHISLILRVLLQLR